jgi:hypothetical protein
MAEIDANLKHGKPGPLVGTTQHLDRLDFHKQHICGDENQ